MPKVTRIPEPKWARRLRRRVVDRATRALFGAPGPHQAQLADPSAADIHKVLICRPNHRLGNLLLLTPLLVELERALPNARIDIVLAGEHVAELFETFPNVGHIYNLSRRMARHPMATMRTVWQIRHDHYDLVIDPCETSQSGHLLLSVAAGRHAIEVPRERSVSDATGNATMTAAPAHLAQLPVFLLRRYLADAAPGHRADFPPLDIRLAVAERRHGRARLEHVICTRHPRVPHCIIGVFAEATASKRYPIEWWRRFLDCIAARHPDAAIVEIAPADGVARIGRLAFASPSPREVAAVIANMTCFISADCGVMHLASAVGVPTLGLFSVSEPLKYAPYGHGSRAIFTNGKRPEEVAEYTSDLIDLIDGLYAPLPTAHDTTGTAANDR